MTEPVFAARGSRATWQERAADLTLHAVLLHSGAPDEACARARGRTLVFAGELYNRDALHRLLPPGRALPGTDAALVSALFDVYDLHVFRLLNGRFAALVTESGRALLATDHVGSVPLYVRVAPGRVLAATEAKALRDAPPGRPVPARPVRRKTGTHQVPAGTVLDIEVATGKCVPHRTWAPPLARRILPEEEATDTVRRAVERAVRTRAGGSTPLVVLSGGIDSSAVAALAARRSAKPIDTVSMGTDAADEFPQARVVARHIGSAHREITVPIAELLRWLPHTVWAAECLDPDIVEYLLPLTALYLRIGGPGRRVLTGYGADIPLGGMHRENRLPRLDTAVCHDMDTFDGLNEMSPTLSAVGGHWTTHPYWDRDVLDVLVSLEAGLKRRHGQDKWVLRAAMSDVLPHEVVVRPKLGVHEGSGTSASFSRLLVDAGAPRERVREAKRLVVREVFDQVVVGGRHPDDVAIDSVVDAVLGAGVEPATARLSGAAARPVPR
nr:asparagine synthase C-terminal domain-containing protein [Streptomyces kanamyceticus]